MKKELQDAFGQITMPESCVQEVTKAMETYQKANQKRQGTARRAAFALTAFAVVLVMAVSFSTEVQAAVSDLVRYIFSDVKITREADDEIIEVSFEESDEGPVFVQTENGKMYFSAYGQYIDITDKTSMETPYIYTYIDEENVEHMLAIGGTADNFGVLEFYRETSDGQAEESGWIGGYSENHINNTTGKAYPWVAAAWEEMNLPWPVPGA